MLPHGKNDRLPHDQAPTEITLLHHARQGNGNRPCPIMDGQLRTKVPRSHPRPMIYVGFTITGILGYGTITLRDNFPGKNRFLR